MSSKLVRVIYGAMAGCLGAACMTVIRMTARRAGVIEKMVPQVAEESLAEQLGIGHRTHPVFHHLADQLLHAGYGATLGATFALLDRGRSPGVLRRGLTYGVVTWFAGTWLLLPLLRAKQAAWHRRASENAVDLAAHLVFGAATALVSEELSAQPDRGPSSKRRRFATRVG